jgi:hypothetical protein
MDSYSILMASPSQKITICDVMQDWEQVDVRRRRLQINHLPAFFDVGFAALSPLLQIDVTIVDTYGTLCQKFVTV